MNPIFVLVEHRRGKIRDITFEMLGKAGDLSHWQGCPLTVVLIGWEVTPFLQELSGWADTILVVEKEELKNFDAGLYQEVLHQLIQEYRPCITLMGQTSWGLDLAPALAVKTGFPLATDCLDILTDGDQVKAIRQAYGGKVFTRVALKKSAGYLMTVRAGAFSPEKTEERKGEIIKQELKADLPEPRRRFVEFVENGAGEIDIAQAEFLISVGRGIGEEENLTLVKDLAQSLGGVLSCSRPIVDKKWLPKFHQVGTSGKSVKPKVYLALGISGAFQHLAGISGAGTVIAVNKDPKAPIFRVADYGVVEDLFKILPALMEKV
ncbi:MAG: electron transfer flavoprotein subunit alpha/FixB family protein [Deltaproteobacteria bacterium]|nr:electron transfer flavoprotein subunit alpha/FixB family protein [Deltaproteobacteria bacterium]